MALHADLVMLARLSQALPSPSLAARSLVPSERFEPLDGVGVILFVVPVCCDKPSVAVWPYRHFESLTSKVPSVSLGSVLGQMVAVDRLFHETKLSFANRNAKPSCSWPGSEILGPKSIVAWAGLLRRPPSAVVL